MFPEIYRHLTSKRSILACQGINAWNTFGVKHSIRAAEYGITEHYIIRLLSAREVVLSHWGDYKMGTSSHAQQKRQSCASCL